MIGARVAGRTDSWHGLPGQSSEPPRAGCSEHTSVGSRRQDLQLTSRVSARTRFPEGFHGENDDEAIRDLVSDRTIGVVSACAGRRRWPSDTMRPAHGSADRPCTRSVTSGSCPISMVQQNLLADGRGPARAEDHRRPEARSGGRSGSGEYPKLQKARRESKDRAKFREVRDAIWKETEAAIQAVLTPEQRERLDQILIQIEGPARLLRGSSFATGHHRHWPASSRSGSDCPTTRSGRVRAIAEEGGKRRS